MSRVLVFGADGILGHRLVAGLSAKHEVIPSVRADVDVRDADALSHAIRHAKPDVVVNAAGVVKQLMDDESTAEAIEVNSVFPHRLARFCREGGARLVHFSTDCVFSGLGGGYRESDAPDGRDVYGLSKLLGEPAYPGCLTLRTSMIGRELRRKTGLLEWFLAQAGPVRGYRRAIFSGLSTQELTRIVAALIVAGKPESGLYHVSAEPISKFELLSLVKEVFGLRIELLPDDDVRIDRSLDSSRFRQETGYHPPGWPAMVKELAAERQGAAS